MNSSQLDQKKISYWVSAVGLALVCIVFFLMLAFVPTLGDATTQLAPTGDSAVNEEVAAYIPDPNPEYVDEAPEEAKVETTESYKAPTKEEMYEMAAQNGMVEYSEDGRPMIKLPNVSGATNEDVSNN